MSIAIFLAALRNILKSLLIRFLSERLLKKLILKLLISLCEWAIERDIIKKSKVDDDTFRIIIAELRLEEKLA